MPTTTCTWIEENLGELLGQRPLPAHLDGCPRCRARFETLERALHAAFNPPPVPLPPELEARILAAVAARSPKRRRVWLGRAVLGVAVACALVLAVDWLFHRQKGNSSGPHVDPDPPKGCAAPW